MATPPPPPTLVNFPGKGEITLDEARKFAGTYGQFLKKPSPEICPEGETSPTCRADLAAVAAVMHTKDYAESGDENSRTMAIVSIDTLYSLAPSDETFLLMFTLRQQLGVDLARMQRKVDATDSTSAIPWGPSTYLMSDALALKASLKHLDRIDAKLSQDTWALEKAVAQKLLGDHRAAIHAAIARAHTDDSLAAHLQSARMEVLVGNREAALDFLNKAQVELKRRTPSMPSDSLTQITIWHRQATLMAPLTDRKKLLQDAAALLEKLPDPTPQRASLAIENVALMAQLQEQELRADLKGNSDDDMVYRIRAIYDSAVAKAEKLVSATDAKGRRTIRLEPLLELKATLAEQQLGIAFAWHNFGDSLARAEQVRAAVEIQLNNDVAGYNILVTPQLLSTFKARHYWAMAQYDFFTGNIQNSLVHLQTIASQHRGTRHEAMLWDKDNWPFLAGIVSGERAFSETLNQKSINAGMKTFMQTYLKRRGTAFLGCEAGALVFTLGTAAITKQFSSAAALAGCFSGNATVAMSTWLEASDLIRQSYVTGLSPVTETQAQEIRNTLLMQTAVAVFSGFAGYIAQRTSAAITAPLQRRLLANTVVNDTPWLHHGVSLSFREASHVAGGLTMGTLSNTIYKSLGETQHQMPLVDHWLMYSALGWIGHLNPGARIFGDAGLTNGMARAFTNISLSGWMMGIYNTLRHPSDVSFLEQTADTTALMGVLHTTLSLGRLVQFSGKRQSALPKPLDEVGASSTSGTGIDMAAYRSRRTQSDKLLNVNAAVTAHLDTFVEEAARIVANRGRFDINLSENIANARGALRELVTLAEAGLVVDVRHLDVIWKTPSLIQTEFRVAALRILAAQVNKGHIRRVGPGVVAYVKEGWEFHLPSVYQVVDQNSWALTRTNIAGLFEALRAEPNDPLLQHMAARTIRQVHHLPNQFSAIKAYCTETLDALLKRHGYDALNDTQLTPIPEFNLPDALKKQTVAGADDPPS